MSHQFLHDFNILPVGNKHRRKGVPKCVPPDPLFYPSPLCSWANYSLQNRFWPKWIFSLVARTGKDPITRSVVPACFWRITLCQSSPPGKISILARYGFAKSNSPSCTTGWDKKEDRVAHISAHLFDDACCQRGEY